MARLKRFEDFRYVGVRDTMRVYDCDDPGSSLRAAQRPTTCCAATS